MSLLKIDCFDDCCVGVVERFGCEQFLIYDKEKVINQLMSDGMTHEEAIEYFDYNMIGSYVGESTVGFITFKDKDQNINDFADEVSFE